MDLQIESVQVVHSGIHIEELSHLTNPRSPGICDDFGVTDIHPRVGDQYQAEIPSLLSQFDLPLPTKDPTVSKLIDIGHYNSPLGSEIPLMLIKEDPGNVKHKKGDSAVGQGISNELCGKYKGRRHCLVPGSLGELWSGIEEASFVLGLYIFGKNLVQVKEFIETKKMGDILEFYYGRFFRSKEYDRWADCRKIRSRKCFFGPKIFTGSRQQELLSRLLPHLSLECQKSLQEASKAFGEGKILLEEYVKAMKTMVGMSNFIEAVGIGKGKQDLTGIGQETLKSNQARPDIPVGKACSSLTPDQIIKFLTGDFRLSKARSHDLFWEAVWPRLLARGWSSEQPKNRGYAASYSLVFLTPGIKKFSRRKLLKGTHYFDSVADVLSKVASEPGLLELEVEPDMGYRNIKDFELMNEKKLEDQDKLTTQPRHCYLQPRTPNHHKNILKFTVVDTSLSCGEEPRIREVRSLPFEDSTVSESRSDSGEEDAYEEPTDESNSVDSVIYCPEVFNGLKTARVISSVLKEFEVSSSNGDCSDSGDLSAETSKNQKTDVPKENPSGKALGVKRDCIDYLAPVTKRRRRYIACSQTETSHKTISVFRDQVFKAPGIKKERASVCSNYPDSSETVVSEVDLSQEKGSCGSSSSTKGSSVSEGILSGGREPQEKPQSWTLIDLNLLPHLPLEFDSDKISVANLTESEDDQTKEQLKINPDGLKTSMDSANVQQQPNINLPRQSTRNRPLTTKALEAFACGFLSSKKSRKRKHTFPEENSHSRRSGCSHGRVVTSKVGDGENEGL